MKWEAEQWEALLMDGKQKQNKSLQQKLSLACSSCKVNERALYKFAQSGVVPHSEETESFEILRHDCDSSPRF